MTVDRTPVVACGEQASVELYVVTYVDFDDGLGMQPLYGSRPTTAPIYCTVTPTSTAEAAS